MHRLLRSYLFKLLVNTPLLNLTFNSLVTVSAFQSLLLMMVKVDFNYPDLDILDSPLMSPFTSSLNGVPGSAIAENIFNDPDSWEENDDADVDADADMEPLAWLVEEIEKFKAYSADLYGAFDPAIDNKRNPDLTPLNGEMQLRTGLKGIDRTSKIRPISIPCFFEPAHDEDIQDRLSKILDASGIPHYVRPLSSDLTPPSTSKATYYPSEINTTTVAGSNVDPSPIALHSSSITMSFLEWYGIYPESDQNLRSLRQQYRKSINSRKVASPMTPPPIYAMPQSPPSSIPPPGLEPPPHLPRSWSHASTLNQSPRSRSPAGSRPNSNSRSRSSPNSRSQSPTGTQDISRRDSDAPARIRRLPSIPLETSLLPPPPPSPKLPSTELPSQQLRPSSTSRPLPYAVCSPAGPRTRGSRVSSQDSTRERGFSLQHRSGLSFNQGLAQAR
jgi:hypothetical protein